VGGARGGAPRGGGGAPPPSPASAPAPQQVADPLQGVADPLQGVADPFQGEGLLAALDRLDERVKSVAIIDDDLNAVRLLKRILQARGQYILYEAHSGREGLEMVRRERPDMVLLDLMMPDLDGFGVLAAMKEEEALQDIPVIVVSAKELTPDEQRRLVGQVRLLLQKGTFTDQDLLEDIQAALDSA
jgi:threonine synthase